MSSSGNACHASKMHLCPKPTSDAFQVATEQTSASASQRCSGHTSEWIGCRGSQRSLPLGGNCTSLSASAKCHFACLGKGCSSSCVQCSGSLAALGGNSQVEKKSHRSPKRGSLGRKEGKHHSPPVNQHVLLEPRREVV